MQVKSFSAATFLVFAAATAQAAPTVIFESAAATGTTSRGAGSGILTRFEVSANTTISNIGIEMDLASAGSIKYFIFNSLSGALLYSSAFQAFADDGMSFKVSDDLSFELEAGTRYAIGAAADVSNVQNFRNPGALTVGAVSSLGRNQNIIGYAFDGGLVGTDGRIRLFRADNLTVPEPGTALLASLALLAALGARRKVA